MADVSDDAFVVDVKEAFFGLLREFGCSDSFMVEAFTIAGKNRNAAKIPILFIEKSLSLISYVLFLIVVNVDCNPLTINIIVQKHILRLGKLPKSYGLSITRFFLVIIPTQRFVRVEPRFEVASRVAALQLFVLALVLILQLPSYISVLSRVSGIFFILAFYRTS